MRNHCDRKLQFETLGTYMRAICSEISAQNWGTSGTRDFRACCLSRGSGSARRASTPAAEEWGQMTIVEVGRFADYAYAFTSLQTDAARHILHSASSETPPKVPPCTVPISCESHPNKCLSLLSLVVPPGVRLPARPVPSSSTPLLKNGPQNAKL